MISTLNIRLIEAFHDHVMRLAARKGPELVNATLESMVRELEAIGNPTSPETLNRVLLESVMTDLEEIAKSKDVETANILLRNLNRQVKSALFARTPVWCVYVGRRVGILTSPEEIEDATKRVPASIRAVEKFLDYDDAVSAFRERLRMPKGVVVWTDPVVQDVTLTSNRSLITVPDGQEQLLEKIFGDEGASGMTPTAVNRDIIEVV